MELIKWNLKIKSDFKKEKYNKKPPRKMGGFNILTLIIYWSEAYRSRTYGCCVRLSDFYGTIDSIQFFRDIRISFFGFGCFSLDSGFCKIDSDYFINWYKDRNYCKPMRSFSLMGIISSINRRLFSFKTSAASHFLQS